jgi:gliding motility-associated-like protein
MCEGFYTQLLAPQGNYQFTWTPASLVSNSGIWNPFAAPPSTTIYTLTLGNGPCYTSNTFSVYIKPRPKALITTNGANLCLTDTAILKTPTAPSYISYVWNTGDTTSTIIVTRQGDYTVTVTDTNGCVTMDTLTLKSIPPYSIDNKSVTICEGESTVLIADTGFTYRWFPEYRLTGQNESQVTVFPIRTTEYTLLISNKRCITAVIHSVIVSPAPSLSLAFNQRLILPGEKIQLFSFSDTKAYWSPDVELSCGDCPNPVVSPLETTTYYCHIVDRYGCTNTHTVLIEVAPTLYVPNCFTPNDDGYNDIFKPEHTGYEKMKLVIYDRWGELLFSKEGLEVGWNGHFRGKVCQDGQYVYKLFATDNRRNYIEKVGTVLLMK